MTDTTRSLMITLVLLVLIGLCIYQIVHEEPAPDIVVNVPPPPEPAVHDHRTGEYDVEYGSWHEYPDGVPAERFERDCTAVCTHARRMRGMEDDAPDGGVVRRVLYLDPETQICACYDNTNPINHGITRYVGWRHVP